METRKMNNIEQFYMQYLWEHYTYMKKLLKTKEGEMFKEDLEKRMKETLNMIIQLGQKEMGG